jgi:hypothetical protein
MKRTRVFIYEIIGSVMEWPVEVYLRKSANEREWEMDIEYTDPAARFIESYVVSKVADLQVIAEERYLDLQAFTTALTKSKQEAIRKLSLQIQVLPEREKCSSRRRKQ